jgi:glycosyltransferase involved in cell wall biosynthesis
MISGMIFQNMAFIEYSPKEYHFLINWDKYYEGKEISKKCLITTEEYLVEKVEKLLQFQIKIIPNELSYFPKVSVILPVYQGEKTIKHAIKSILKQGYPAIELVIINDGSTDKTDEIVISIMKKNNQIKYIKNEENKGVYFSRNLGIRESTSDFITMQDADDISDLKRIGTSISHLIQGKYEFVLANGKYIRELIIPTNAIRVTIATFFCRKLFFEKYGYYDENTRHSGDLELLDRAYFLKYREYKFDNFWYWLNYTSSDFEFYGHIYENLYYVRLDGERITKKNKIKKRIQYLNQRRKEFKNM